MDVTKTAAASTTTTKRCLRRRRLSNFVGKLLLLLLLSFVGFVFKETASQTFSPLPMLKGVKILLLPFRSERGRCESQPQTDAVVVVLLLDCYRCFCCCL